VVTGRSASRGRSGAPDDKPLKQFGVPRAGCTIIQYQGDGTWRDLEKPTRPRRRRAPLDWDTLLSRLKVDREPNAVALPKARALDDYEKATGFTLPEGYRRFALALGPGDVGGDHFRIAVPGYPKNRDTVDLARMNQRYRGLADAPEGAAKYDDPGRVRRLVAFCHTGGGDYYGWDPEDVRDAAAHEYGVYLVPRHGKRVEQVAGSFLDFLGDYCLGPGYRARLRDRSLAPRRVFVAANDDRDKR
jgi:SMI1 / KNR4 family (SUKH-1)